MPYQANYPATVAEILDDSMKFNPAALRAVRDLAAAKPWRGTPAERENKFRRCVNALAAAYGIRPPTLDCGAMNFDCYLPGVHAIHLTRRMSVVTLLHEFGHARRFDERQTCRWSVNLFRRCFPRSYAACTHVAHTLVNPFTRQTS